MSFSASFFKSCRTDEKINHINPEDFRPAACWIRTAENLELFYIVI